MAECYNADCSIWPFQWSMLLWMFNFHFQFWMIDCAKSWREPRPTHNQLWTSDRKPLIKYWKMPSERASRSSEGFKHAGRKKRRVKYFNWNRPKNAYLRQDLMRGGSEAGEMWVGDDCWAPPLSHLRPLIETPMRGCSVTVVLAMC